MALQVNGLQATPAQTLTVSLAQQACQIKIYQLSTGLYLDLYVNDDLIIGGVLCENQNRIVRNAYLGFIGDLTFLDNTGEVDRGVTIFSDPDYTGLGSRFSLMYLEADEVLGDV